MTTGTDNADYWHLQDHGNCHLHPSPALGDGQDGLQGIPGHPPMEGISSRIFLVYNFTAYGLDLDKLFQIAYPGGQGAVMSLDEMNEEWWCDLPLASFPADTVSNTKWVQYIELSTDVL